MTKTTHSPQPITQLTLTLPRADRARWHALAMTHGLRPAGLAQAVLHAVDNDPDLARAIARAAEELRHDH